MWFGIRTDKKVAWKNDLSNLLTLLPFSVDSLTLEKQGEAFLFLSSYLSFSFFHDNVSSFLTISVPLSRVMCVRSPSTFSTHSKEQNSMYGASTTRWMQPELEFKWSRGECECERERERNCTGKGGAVGIKKKDWIPDRQPSFWFGFGLKALDNWLCLVMGRTCS